MKFLSTTDLCDRWVYTRAGIHKLINSKEFPQPITTVNRGRIKIFSEEAIEAYEQEKPWLFDEGEKLMRQRLYALLQMAKENPEEREVILKKCFGNAAQPWKG